VLGDSNFRRMLGEAACNDVRKRFSASSMGAAYERVFKRTSKSASEAVEAQSGILRDWSSNENCGEQEQGYHTMTPHRHIHHGRGRG